MPRMLYIAIIIACYSLNQQFCSAQRTDSLSNDCSTYGRCGAFGICDSLNSPICSCLQGFDPVNSTEWSSGNWSSGCVRRVPLACERNNGTSNGSRQDGFLELQEFKISGYSARQDGSGSATMCEDLCLRNCTCLAYDYTVGDACLFWSGNLTDIQRSPSSTGSHLHIRVAGSELLGRNKDDKKIKTKMIAIIVIVVVGVIVSICGYLCWKRVNRKRGEKSTNKDEKPSTLDSVDASIQDALSRVNLLEFPLFKIEVLANATRKFSEDKKLGRGGFGFVYKGELPNGKEIAVKRLSEASGQGLREFMNEVELISKLQHRNLVRLLGCCVENNEKMLIYEYMPNKSLDASLFDPLKNTLDWRKRLNIIEGICRGLLYLHRDSRLKIIHRDMKPSNILLDTNWNPKISDFGMAKIYGTNQDHIRTARVVGTFGYMAPEYAMEGIFSEKSDVFSFGVMMLEIATGRRNTSFFRGEGSLVNLLGHVWRLWNEDNAATVMDSRISSDSSSSNNMAEVLRCMHIGLLCVQQLPKDRPSMSAILSMLSSETIELPNPNRPASFVKLTTHVTGSSSSQHGQNSSYSVNNVTLTIIDGR